MKRFIITILIFTLYAAPAMAQLVFGLEGTLLFSNYQMRSLGETFISKAKFGVSFGGVASIRLTPNLYVQPGLLYVMNGYKADGVNSVSVTTGEVPLPLIYKFGRPGGGRFYIGAGPYIAKNFAGSNGSSSFKIGNGVNNDLKPFDAGLCFDLGIEPESGVYIHLHYQKGLVDLIPENSIGSAAYSTNYGVSVGYLFGTRHPKKRNQRPIGKQ